MLSPFLPVASIRFIDGLNTDLVVACVGVAIETAEVHRMLYSGIAVVMLIANVVCFPGFAVEFIKVFHNVVSFQKTKINLYSEIITNP